MKKKEIKIKVRELLSSGASKTDVFTRLSGQGMKDRHLAYVIAAHVEPDVTDKFEKLNNAAIMLMFVQAFFAFFLGHRVGAAIGPNAMLIFALAFGAIPLLFAWGFYKHAVGAYNAYILLTVIQWPKALEGFSQTPVVTSIGFLISGAMLALIWYLRFRLFPDFLFMSPRKVKGKYVFTN
jgi:hypothetical protein